MFLSSSVELSKSYRQWICHYFSLSHIFKGDNWHFFGINKKLSCWLFGRHCFRDVFQTLPDYNLAQGLAIHISFDDIDFISRSQVCQNHRLQILFRFLSTVVDWCNIAIHIRKIKHSITHIFNLCVVYI